MTYLLPAAIILFFFQGCWSRAQFSTSVGCTSTDYEANVSCLIINLDYVECNWTKPQMQQINYTFRSAFSWNSFSECPEYLQEQGQNVGCRIPLKPILQRFEPFRTKLSVGGNQSICKNYTDLKPRVKLNPPYILSVNSTDREGEVCVHWLRSKIKENCVNYTVAYQKASGPWKISIPVISSSYCVSPVASGVLYTFQVRSSMSDLCGPSDFWSDWSNQVQWSNNKDVDTEQHQVYWHVLGSVLGVILLICLSLLLYYSERIKVVFVPVVPAPSKSLQDLFKKYNGNVESWVYINRELKDAFEPDFTESPPCVVCEAGPTVETKTEEGPVEQPVS